MYWLAMQGLKMPTVYLLMIGLSVTIILSVFVNILEKQKGGICMKKIIHKKLKAKMLFMSIGNNFLMIARSATATALSANAFYS